jgi:membrane protein
LLSFAMVVGIGFLLLVSLVVSAALSAVNNYLSGLIPGLGVLWTITNAMVSFGVITLLFAMIFKILPDVKIAWRDVWIGAGTTALLFTLGKFLLGMYLGKSSIVSAYGAAGSTVLLLLWVYYSAQILFFGAEVTQVYANRFGARFELKKNARWAAGTQKNPFAKTKTGVSASPESNNQPPERRTRLIADLKRELESLRQLVER